MASDASRVAVITGASSGIGAATSQAFAAGGWRIAALGRDRDRLTAVCEAIAAAGGTALPLVADVSDPAALSAAAAATLAHFGRVDAVVANAGVSQRGALLDAAWDDLDAVLRTNIDGVLHTIRAYAPHLPRGGQIVIVSSVVATMVTPFTSTYSASKAFVSSLARALRIELADVGVGVIDVRVGRTATPFNQNRRGGTGYSSSASRIPMLTPEAVAQGIVTAVDRGQKTVVLRLFDRLLLWASAIVPDVIGRLAARQYR